MMRLLLFILISVNFSYTCAQDTPGSHFLELDIPQRAEQTFSLFIKQGVQNDTVLTAQLDNKGHYLYDPKGSNTRSGIMVFSIPPYTWFEFIWSGNETFTISCLEEYPHTENVTFLGTRENVTLNRWLNKQYFLYEKKHFCEQGMKLYKEPSSVYLALKKEYESLREEELILEDSLKQSSLYASRYIQIQRFLYQKATSLIINSDSSLWNNTRDYLRDSLNMETLYTSGMWFNVLNSCLELYAKKNLYHGKFSEDVIHILNRIRALDIYTVYANDMLTVCEQLGWEYEKNHIVKYLLSSKRITNPSGRLKKMMTMGVVKADSLAPEIMGSTSKFIPKQSLVIFHDSDCNSCKNELIQLQGNYKIFEEKGFQVISISADNDPEKFEYHAKDFPWENKFCDYKGFEGDNFRNYGVSGTPTIFVIDQNGIISDRCAKLSDIKMLN